MNMIIYILVAFCGLISIQVFYQAYKDAKEAAHIIKAEIQAKLKKIWKK